MVRVWAEVRFIGARQKVRVALPRAGLLVVALFVGSTVDRDVDPYLKSFIYIYRW